MTNETERVDPLEWLNGRPIGVLATIGRDGLARVVPVEVVVFEARVYSWCNATSVKARNAARNGSATFMAYKGNDWVMVRGKARVFGAEDQRYQHITKLFLSKYDRDDDFGNDALVEVDADVVTSRIH